MDEREKERKKKKLSLNSNALHTNFSPSKKYFAFVCVLWEIANKRESKMREIEYEKGRDFFFYIHIFLHWKAKKSRSGIWKEEEKNKKFNT